MIKNKCSTRNKKKYMLYFYSRSIDMKEEKKNNVFVDFILAFIYIPVYALRGIKFILFDK